MSKMALVKVDKDSLITLNRQLTQQLDRYCLKISEIFSMQNTLSGCWNEQQAGSFQNFIDTVKASKVDVETCVISIRQKIAKMIEIADKYNSKRF